MKETEKKLKKPKKNKITYDFSIEFQQEVLRYILQSKSTLEILTKIKPSYFTLIEHSLIYEAIKKFVKKYQKVPSKVLLIEAISTICKTNDYRDLITKEDLIQIQKIIHSIYQGNLQDSEIIGDKVYKFAAYIEMRKLNESIDLTDFTAYEDYQNTIAKIIKESKPQAIDDGPLYMVKDIHRRQMLRKTEYNIIPTPLKQLNKLTNSGGLPKNTIAVIIDRPKKKKTFSLVNLARGYLAMQKNVLYIDLENGKNQIMERIIQSTLNKTRLQMLSNDYDDTEQRQMRKYKRLGVECIVERVPALITNCNKLNQIIRQIESEKGIKIHIVMLDYAAKLASNTGTKDDIKRIDEVYIELDNLATELDLDVIWTAQHVTREGAKARSNTVYDENDIASAITIVRNAQLIVGLNQTLEEEKNNVQRMEIVAQRDGLPHGRVLLHTSVENQRWEEFSKEAQKTYNEKFQPVIAADAANKVPRNTKPANIDSDL